jgi:ABC-type bacteriocin/lantibiotic exporter with double-glycine peptidase domain
MVLRYWGRPVLHDEIAAELASPDLHGAAGSALADLARRQGLRAAAFAGDLDALRDAISRQRPVVVSWALGGGRFHDVVVVGFEEGRVIVHDPARGAERRIAAHAFEERWAGAGHWALLIAPPATP